MYRLNKRNHIFTDKEAVEEVGSTFLQVTWLVVQTWINYLGSSASKKILMEKESPATKWGFFTVIKTQPPKQKPIIS